MPFYCEMKWLLITEFFVTLPNMKILFIPNWRVNRLSTDVPTIQAPDKQVQGEPYWFFKYFPEGTQVDIIDIGEENQFRKIEHKIKFYLVQPWKAFRVRKRYDLVISHGAQSGLVYELLSSFVKRKPQHLMFDIGGLNGARVNHTEMPLIRWALRKAPHIIVHASRQLSLYAKHYPKLAPKATFIPFGNDVDYFTPKEVAMKKQILTFGRAKRDNDTLCEAFSGIADKKGYKLVVVGAGALKEKYPDGDIEFLDPMPLKDLVTLSRESAFIVVPLPEYLYSYGQMSFLQSMALGKALIVTETTSSADYISDAPGVERVRPYDVGDMKAALQRMMASDFATLQQRGLANREFVTSHFSERQMAERIVKFISTFLNF